MYTYKNKAFSFLETIVSISIVIFFSSISFSLVKSMSTTFFLLNNDYKKEKNIIAIKNLLHGHIFWIKNPELRLINIKNSNNSLIFREIFSKKSENNGNTLIIKYNFFDSLENKIYTVYRCFSFYEKNFSIFYFNQYDFFKLNEGRDSAIIAKNYQGSFYLENNYLKLIIKDLENDENYEITLPIL